MPILTRASRFWPMLAAGLVLAPLSCFSPKLVDGKIPCASGDRSCPPGFQCAQDSLCYRIGYVSDGPSDGHFVGDGPSDANSDAIPANCGNGILDPGEQCDPQIAGGQLGACPGGSDCGDGDPCTIDQVLGQAVDCTAYCNHAPIVACGGNSDNCCPRNCTAAADPDCSPTCGNGVVDLLETCDKGITQGMTGACPPACDDGNACTTDHLVGAADNCTAKCVAKDVTACGPHDSCCPSSCNANNDTDCSPRCGNGVREAGETCDTAIPVGQLGACPGGATACADNDACTSDTLVGTGCTQVCQNSPITSCTRSDGCCPAGCNALNDTDCSPMCGNQVVEPGETCDPPSSCPTTCDDHDACTRDSAPSGSPQSCNVTCSHTPITTCGDDTDGCCPSGCGSAQDMNCAAGSCGNGFLEMGELCDSGISAGQPGACPQSDNDCNDGNACTTDALAGTGCQRTCTNTAKTCNAVARDGCCPAGCNANNDMDCAPMCGNSVVEIGETCDPPASCPTLQSCNDNDACTNDFVVGNPNLCNSQCSHSAVTTCDLSTSDGCCPGGCNANTDADCSPQCGNGVVESGELCDAGIPAGQPGACPTVCSDSCEYVVSGTGCQAQCVYQPSGPGCVSSGADQCCPHGCTSGTDSDCAGSWTYATLASNISYPSSPACDNISVFLQQGHSYVLTTCKPVGPALAGATDDTVLRLNDPNGTEILFGDDCYSSFMDAYGWNCQDGNGFRYASCITATAGGFQAPVTGTYTLCVQSYGGTHGGNATVTLWSN